MHQEQEPREIIVQMDKGVFWSIVGVLALFTCAGVIGVLILVQFFI